MPESTNPSTDHGQALPTGTRLEEFVIERILGSGGFGITYLARDTALGRQVVIKENLPVQFCFRDTHSLTVAPRHSQSDDAENFHWSLENFSREAAMLASLEHPGIVRVLRSFQAFGTAYFVMPFMEGVALDELAKNREGKPFSEDELRGMLERVLGALSYLHDRGIYHRDIKPGNLLITNDGIPVLIDFGSARQRLSERSMTVVESPGYTPFEQLQTRGNVGPWSDLYALGATLVKLITGEAPPKTNDRTMGDPWQPLAGRADMVGKFSQSFLAGIDRALRLPVEERWQDAGEWLAALRAKTAEELPHAAAPKHQASSVSSAPSQLATGSEKKANFVPWVVAACVVLGLIAVTKNMSGDKAEHRTDTEESAIQSEHEEAEAKATMDSLSLTGSKAGEGRDFEIAPGVKMTFCWIPPGEFMMGSPKTELGRDDDEMQHRVKISKGFWLAKTEVTQAQWLAVMGSNPSRLMGDDLPVESVSWNDIAGDGGFIQKAHQTAATEGGRYHLPSEAQWEYACRAGTKGAYAGDLHEMAWHAENSGSRTHPVGQKEANAWGLYDMHGNVWEWCADRYGPYSDSTVVDPSGSSSSSRRVSRGGSWYDGASNCRVAYRSSSSPDITGSNMGFRLARSSVP